MFSPCKTKCSKSKTKCLRFSTLQNHIKNSVRTAFLPNSNAIIHITHTFQAQNHPSSYIPPRYSAVYA